MIFYFSGTGNSRLVAERLSRLLGDSTVRITNDTALSYTLDCNERVVWVFPVYSWGVPPVVRNFIKNVRITGTDALHSMVCTCGDDCGMTYEMWRKDIRGKGWRSGCAFSVQMPNVYVSLPGFDVDSQKIVKQKLADAPERLKLIARAIAHDSRAVDVVRGALPRVKTCLLYPAFRKFLMSPRFFRHTDACVECGKCASSCPMKNITMTDAGPKWGSECAMCLACYHFCPHDAVAYGKFTSDKGHYVAPAEFPESPETH